LNNNQKQKIQLIVSVDTEEEWDWSGPFPQDNCSVENIKYLPEFQKFCDELGIRPTYFVDYAVADNPLAANTLKRIAQGTNCEIGAHLHPWSNPPYRGVTKEHDSHVVNLPIALVEQKLDALTALLTQVFGKQPRAFRTGRWGINGQVLKLLAQKNYNIDSSVYPYYSTAAFSCDRAHETPYWPNYSDPMEPGSQRDIFEVPITAGFNRSGFRVWNRIHRFLSSPPWSRLKIVGVFWHTHLLRKIYLSPELSKQGDMVRLVDKAIESGHRQIHMFMHSSSLLPGAYCFEGQNNKAILEGILHVYNHLCHNYEVECCTLSEFKEKFADSKTS